MAPVAYLLGRFPSVSHTFVYREIAHLQRLHGSVHTYALSRSDDPDHGILKPRDIQFVPSASLVLRRKPASQFLRARWLEHGGRIKDLRRAEWLARRWTESKVGAVHVHFLGHAAALAAVACAIGDIPLVVTVHARGLLVPHPLGRLTLELATRIRTISAKTSEWVGRQWTGTPHLIPLPIAEAPLSGPSADEQHVLTVCRPVPKKGLAVVSSALSRMDTIRWTVAGASASEIKSAPDRLRALGPVPFSVIDEVYRDGVDLFVLPCQVAPDGDEDAVPMAIMEAMARGVAVVSSPVGGIPELIDDGVSGVLVPPGDSGALRDAIDRLLRDREARTSMGIAGRNRVRETRRPDALNGALLSLLAEVTDG